MAVLDIASPALEGMQRRWPNQGRGIDLVDMNANGGQRERHNRLEPTRWPAVQSPAQAELRHCHRLPHRTTGLECSDFIIGDRRLPEVSTLIDLYPVRQVWDSTGYPGLLHNAFTDVGIPSICPEVVQPASSTRISSRPSSRGP